MRAQIVTGRLIQKNVAVFEKYNFPIFAKKSAAYLKIENVWKAWYICYSMKFLKNSYLRKDVQIFRIWRVMYFFHLQIS